MNQLIWILIAVVVGFLIPFIFGNNTAVPIDMYYLIYFLSVCGLLVAYARFTNLDVRKTLTENLAVGILLGLVFAGIMARNVFSRPETGQLAGGLLLWAMVWRGIVYGAVDGLFLSAFPWIVTWRAFNGGDRPIVEKAGLSLLAWFFVLLITTAYHAGYKDFRSKKLIQPNIGNTIISLPTFISGNPIAAAIAHAGMHLAAVIHSPQTDLFLPPHR